MSDKARELVISLRSIAEHTLIADFSKRDHINWKAADLIESQSTRIAEIEAKLSAKDIEIAGYKDDIIEHNKTERLLLLNNSQLQSQLADLEAELDKPRESNLTAIESALRAKNQLESAQKGKVMVDAEVYDAVCSRLHSDYDGTTILDGDEIKRFLAAKEAK